MTEGEESEEEEGGVTEIKIDMGEVGDSEIKWSDQFEDCELEEELPLFLT